MEKARELFVNRAINGLYILKMVEDLVKNVYY